MAEWKTKMRMHRNTNGIWYHVKSNRRYHVRIAVKYVIDEAEANEKISELEEKVKELEGKLKETITDDILNRLSNRYEEIKQGIEDGTITEDPDPDDKEKEEEKVKCPRCGERVLWEQAHCTMTIDKDKNTQTIKWSCKKDPDATENGGG